MKRFSLISSLVLMYLLLLAHDISEARLQASRPSGKIKAPPRECNQEHDSDCCVAEKYYTTYECSCALNGRTRATLTRNSFKKVGDGDGHLECDNNYHSDSIPIVALSTGWYNVGSTCFNNITIRGNGRCVITMVVDECDSAMGCDDDRDYQPPCPNNIVDGSKSVREALGISDPDDVGSL